MEIKEVQFVTSCPDVEKCPTPDRPEYAFIGRSNVGKSSLINMLTGRNNLAKVSSSPGKTTLINYFKIHSGGENEGWYLVDLPGYGFAKRSKSQREQWKKMITGYLRKRQNLQTVFVLIDSRISPQKSDMDFISQLGEWQIPFQIVFTKTDKNKQSETAKNIHTFLAALSETWEPLPEHFVTSSVKRTGREKMLLFIEKVNQTF